MKKSKKNLASMIIAWALTQGMNYIGAFENGRAKYAMFFSITYLFVKAVLEH